MADLHEIRCTQREEQAKAEEAGGGLECISVNVCVNTKGFVAYVLVCLQKDVGLKNPPATLISTRTCVPPNSY